LGTALKWRREKSFHEFSNFSLPLWGMQQKSLQNAQVKKCIRLVTFEDHLVVAGFGAWILEAANDSLKKITIKGLDPKVQGQVGSQTFLTKKYFR
jgi:transketolase C-terminal domain/subunit